MTCPTIAKREAALRAFHNSFPSRTRAVMRYVDELTIEWRRDPPVCKPPVMRSDDQFDAEREADAQGITVAQYIRGY
jgi:hypothetical protein